MMSKKVFYSFALIMLILTLAVSTSARMRSDQGKTQDDYFTAAVAPAFCMTEHNVGKMVLAVTNYGCFGDGFTAGSSSNCFTGLSVLSCEYPKGSRTRYNFASAFWFGAIVGRDTLVSVGADGWNPNSFEMFPDEVQEVVIAPRKDGTMIHRSIMDPAAEEFIGAISEQDYIGVYTDTFTTGVPGLPADEITGLEHQPLHIEVVQRSFAWSYPYAEDFILFDYAIKNIGFERLEAVYMGVYCDADIMGANQQSGGYTDDIAGFTRRLDLEYCDRVWDTEVNAAWIADNSGKLDQQPGSDEAKVPNITSTRIVRTPSDSLQVSFNWWVSNGASALDFGPQRKGHVRDLGHGGTGTPSGDRNKYAFLSNGEFDYDQYRTAEIRAMDTAWSLPPPLIAVDISDGFDTRYLLSFGPFNIDPGQTLPLSLAWVGGENFHTNTDNVDNLRQATYSPDDYFENLNFKDLGTNSLWASWIYDNPGIDTDSDGYAGEYHLVCDDSTIASVDTNEFDPNDIDTIWAFDLCDTCWYQGDGIPDFQGAKPPPAPAVWVEPDVGRIRVRWNGLRSETETDPFSREKDFEGYRVWLSRDSLQETAYNALTSYDREDYNKLVYNNFTGQWELKDIPYTAQALRCLYGNSCNDEDFDPNLYSQASNPFQLPGYSDSLFLFVPQDYNRSELGVTTEIRKTYPNQPYPSSLSPELAMTSELTEDGYLKYFEYYYVIENLLHTVEYYINVTAFDYGSPQSGLASLETPRNLNFHRAFAINTVQAVARDGLEVYVYPNPYIDDGRYEAAGFEDVAGQKGGKDFSHRLHFANLPAKCMISIFSLDGDLVAEVPHDKDPNDPEASIDEWRMISRNTQTIVTGIYYYTVDDGTNVQTGKFVVIR